MKPLIIAALLLAGCSTKKPEPFMSSSVSTPFEAGITESGEALEVRFQTQKCIGGTPVIEQQSLRVPLGALAQCKGGLVEQVIKGLADNILLFGSGFWIGAN